MLEITRAETAFSRNDNEEALARLLWCFDHGLDQDPGFFGVLSTAGTDLFANLAERYPPAKLELIQRVSALERQVLKDPDRDYVPALTLIAINDATGDDARTVRMLERLRERRPRSTRGESEFAIASFDSMVRLDRHDLLTAYGQAILAYHLKFVSAKRPAPQGESDIQLAGERGAALYYSALVTRQPAEAKRLAATLMTLCKTPQAFALLHEYGMKANAAEETAWIRQEAEAVLNESDRTLFHLLIAPVGSP